MQQFYTYGNSLWCLDWSVTTMITLWPKKEKSERRVSQLPAGPRCSGLNQLMFLQLSSHNSSLCEPQHLFPFSSSLLFQLLSVQVVGISTIYIKTLKVPHCCNSSSLKPRAVTPTRIRFSLHSLQTGTITEEEPRCVLTIRDNEIRSRDASDPQKG